MVDYVEYHKKYYAKWIKEHEGIRKKYDKKYTTKRIICDKCEKSILKCCKKIHQSRPVCINNEKKKIILT